MCPTLVETLSSETAEKQRFELIFTLKFRKMKFPDISRDSHEIEKGKLSMHCGIGKKQRKSHKRTKQCWSWSNIIFLQSMGSNKNKISASSTYIFLRDHTRTKPDKFPSDKHRQMQHTKWTGVHQHMRRTQSLLKTDLPFFSKKDCLLYFQ